MQQVWIGLSCIQTVPTSIHYLPSHESFLYKISQVTSSFQMPSMKMTTQSQFYQILLERDHQRLSLQEIYSQGLPLLMLFKA